MEDPFPLNRKLEICPYCARTERSRSAGVRREPDPEQKEKTPGGLPEFLAELRRNFQYEVEASTPFSVEPVWAEAVAP